MNICPECNNRIYQYQDGDWLEWICWRCGHYESNTPAFKSVPYLFRHLVRNNPIHLKKYAHYKESTGYQFFVSDDTIQFDESDRPDVNDTEPYKIVF